MFFQNIFFLKEFLVCNGWFGLFTKIKNGLILTFGAHFLYDFSKNVPYLIFYEWIRFQCHTFFLLKILNKMHYQVFI